jgi:hypothetical protein
MKREWRCVWRFESTHEESKYGSYRCNINEHCGLFIEKINGLSYNVCNTLIQPLYYNSAQSQVIMDFCDLHIFSDQANHQLTHVPCLITFIQKDPLAAAGPPAITGSFWPCQELEWVGPLSPNEISPSYMQNRLQRCIDEFILVKPKLSARDEASLGKPQITFILGYALHWRSSWSRVYTPLGRILHNSLVWLVHRDPPVHQVYDSTSTCLCLASAGICAVDRPVYSTMIIY